MLKKYLTLVLALICLYGCQSTNIQSSILESYTKDSYPVAMKPGYGLIVSSFEKRYGSDLKLQGALETSLVIFPETESAERKESFNLTTSDYQIYSRKFPQSNQVRVANGQGTVILSAYQVPAGKYRLGMKQASGRVGTIRHAWIWGDRTERPTPYATFEVKEGEITYLGRQVFLPALNEPGKLLMGMVQQDTLEEDMERLYKTRPELIGISITSGI